MSKDNEDDISKNVEGDDTKNQGEDGTTSSAEGDESDDDLGNQGQVDDDAGTDDPNELKEKLKKTSEANTKLFNRLKKAQGFVQDKDGNWVKPVSAPTPKKNQNSQQQQTDDLTSRDVIALMNAQVTNEEDINEVKDYARLKKISIAEALKSTVVRTILSERSEERKTANATNTGTSRRSSTKPNLQSVIDKAHKSGELPEGEEDLNKLAEAEMTKR